MAESSSILEIFQKPTSAEDEAALPQLWRWTLFVAIPFTLYFLYRDLGVYLQFDALDRVHFRPDALAWRVFCALQIAHKLPLTRPYPLRGAAAGFDLMGLALGLVAAAIVPARPVAAPPGLWWTGLGIMTVWMLFQAWVSAFPPLAGRLRAAPGRRLYAAFASGLIPNVPFVFAFHLLATAS